MQTLTLEHKNKVKYKRDKGHNYINIPIVCKGSTEKDTINFIYDTGAYLTVVNKDIYEWFNLNELPRNKLVIKSYDGITPGYLFQIPGLMIGSKLLAGIWAFTPDSNEVKQNLLGDNVIEYFRPFQDNLNDCIYFLENPNPEPYISPDGSFTLACDGVFLLENLGE
ncbi:MAG: hypothetical protein FWD38_04755 [Oscillospiraceae bacterium]|nr:hypothetical protein [Oscillospiraceae bacterium]